MEANQRLFEFLCMLIDIQIKKYVSLARIGVGPDASMNAKLVFDQVNELMPFLEELLVPLENHSQNKADNFQAIFNRIFFYLTHEHLRGYAGWLIDENPIHTPEFNRLQEQLAGINNIGELARIDLTLSSIAETELQKQSQYDSYAISFLILDVAIKLRDNPEMQLGNEIPAHATRILRKHATGPDGRYYRKDIFTDIKKIHAKCQNFLNQSVLKKSITMLSLEEAKQKADVHRDKLNSYLARYKTVNPGSKLFAPTFRWYEIGHLHEQNKPEAKVTSSKHAFWTATAVIVLAVCYAIYKIGTQNSQLEHLFCNKRY